jgi:hypothetical protein
VRELLGLGAAELRESQRRGMLAADVLHLGRLGEGDRRELGEAFGVRGHEDEVEVELLAAVEAALAGVGRLGTLVVPVELGEEEGGAELARAVASVVVEDDRVAVGDA